MHSSASLVNAAPHPYGLGVTSPQELNREVFLDLSGPLTVQSKNHIEKSAHYSCFGQELHFHNGCF